MAEESKPADAQVTPPAPAVTPEAVAAPEIKTPPAPAAPVEAKPEAKAPEQKVVPEKYDLKLPEGSRLDAKAVDDLAVFAKSKGMTNADAQALLERESARDAAYVEGQKQLLEAENTKWVEAVKTDKEIGGDKLAKSVETAKRVIERFATPELKKELNETGLGDHPELVRLLNRIGSAMSEDQLVVAPATETVIDPQNAAARLFPKTAGAK